MEKHIEEEEETTFDKGRNLENEFSLFMRHELGWKKTRVGAHMAGKLNRKGTSIDVIGERPDERGRRLHNLSLIYLLVGFMLLAIGSMDVFLELDLFGDFYISEIFILLAVIFIFGALFTILVSVKLSKENAWVECKNLKGKVNINQIDKSIRELKDYKASGDKEYKFEYHYFVSANGYVENALKYAIEHGLICYEKSGDTFKKVGYWD